jgi:multimeric flavodoxin WrbA
MTDTLKAVALVCTLNASPTDSSSSLIGSQVLDELKTHGVEGELFRVVDFDVKRGVQTDMGDGDEWPKLRKAVLDADIILIATPIWMGHPASVTQMVLERLDAEISETDDEGRPILFGKVGIVAVVGNEDGAHKVSADVFQALNDVGLTIPAQGVTYWNGAAMQAVDYKDLSKTPDKTAETTKTMASNAAHLAGLLKKSNYPAE